MTTGEKYVTAAYCVVFAIVLVYVVIIALKLQRLEREVDELAARKTEDADERETTPLAELLFWPALLALRRGRGRLSRRARRPGIAGRRRRGACGSAGSCRPRS